MIIETPTRFTTTLAERLIRTGEAILDLASALPPDLDRIVCVRAAGWDGRGHDVEVQFRTVADALRSIRSIGGVWQHTLTQMSGGSVHHVWAGQHNGADVQLVAIWSPREHGGASQVKWSESTDWKVREHSEHPEVPEEKLTEAIDLGHRMELAGAL